MAPIAIYKLAALSHTLPTNYARHLTAQGFPAGTSTIPYYSQYLRELHNLNYWQKYQKPRFISYLKILQATLLITNSMSLEVTWTHNTSIPASAITTYGQFY